jgi:hypothetical protein
VRWLFLGIGPSRVNGVLPYAPPRDGLHRIRVIPLHETLSKWSGIALSVTQ